MPILAYHIPVDLCLVLDKASFEYATYLVKTDDLYEATKPSDTFTEKSRGWFLVYTWNQRRFGSGSGSK